MHSTWMSFRSLTQDSSVTNQKLKPGTLKRIAKFAIPYKVSLSLFLVTVVIDAFLIVATPLLLRKLIDDGVIPKDSALVTKLALAVGIIAILDALFSMIGRWFSARIGEGLIYDLRRLIFEHVQKQSIAFFTRTQTGALISRLNSDVIGAQQAFTSTLSGVISNLLSLILVAATMLTLSWQITLISLTLLPVFLIPTKWVGRKLQGYTRESFDINASMSSTMTERFNVSGALLVSLYGNSRKEKEEFSAKARKVADIGISIAMLNRVFFIALTSIAAVATAVAYGFGGHLAINSEITVGTLLAITALLARLYGPLTALSNVRVDVMSALVSFERVFEVLDLQPMVVDQADAIELAAGKPSVVFENVSFTYPKADQISLASLEMVAKPEVAISGPTLQNISFEANSGTLTGIVGPSGAGKSTISSLIPRLYDVTQGSIKIDGKDIRQYSIKSLRGSIGVVTQDSHMFHDSILNNLLYANPEASLTEIESACESARIWSFIELSGGEKQRLAIARLLLKQPSLVILDEATAHLDSENEALVQAALKEALTGRTSIVIAHRLSTIIHADQILVIDNGEIIERGTHEELVARGGMYFDLYEQQNLQSDLI